MKRRAALLVAVVFFAGGCGGADRVSIETLAHEPESFRVADRVFVSGFALGDGAGSVLFCNGLSDERPPRADGPCVEAEGVPLTKAGRDHHVDGVWWSERRDLDCLVVRGMPAPANPSASSCRACPRDHVPDPVQPIAGGGVLTDVRQPAASSICGPEA